MNFKKIVFFVTFVLPSALFTSDHPTSDLNLFTRDLDHPTIDHPTIDHPTIDLNFFTSDRSRKKRKVEETDENTQLEETAQKTQPKEAVQLSKKTYQKDELLDFCGKSSFKVLVNGPAQHGYVYVKHIEKNTNGLLNIKNKLFAVGYTYNTVADLLEDLKKRDSFF